VIGLGDTTVTSCRGSTGVFALDLRQRKNRESCMKKEFVMGQAAGLD
jgi:hypothetical protein